MISRDQFIKQQWNVHSLIKCIMTISFLILAPFSFLCVAVFLFFEAQANIKRVFNFEREFP